MARRRKKKKNKLINTILTVLFVAILVYYKDDIDLDKILTSAKEIIAEKTEKEVSKPQKVENLTGLEVQYIDVGQADAILIRDNGENMLIDAGNNEDGEKLVTYFKSLGITRFKYIVGTHPHEDHIGGLDNVINSFSLNKFFMPDVYTTTKTFEEVLDALDAKNKPASIPTINKVYKLKDATFRVVHYGKDKEDLNNDSIIIHMVYGNTRFLFTGDAEISAEKEILNSDIKSDVLKLGHHGSTFSTSNDFLYRVNPKYAVISVGKDNDYHHPHLGTLRKLDKNNIKYYRTDEQGTIIVKSDGNKIKIETRKTDTNG